MTGDWSRPFRVPGGERRSGRDRRGPDREAGRDRRGKPCRTCVGGRCQWGRGPCKVWDLGQGGTGVFTQEEVEVATNLPVRHVLRCTYDAVTYPFLAMVAWSAKK